MSPTALSSLPAPAFAKEYLQKSYLPSSLDLYRVFNQWLVRRVNFSAQYFSAPLEDMSPLPVEQSIYFSEPLEGLLVVRSTKTFERLLESASGASFLEMTFLYYHRLFLDIWKLDTRNLKPALFKASVPVAWPDRKPNVACTAFVEDSPVEIRFWASLSKDEVEHWGKAKR